MNHMRYIVSFVLITAFCTYSVPSANADATTAASQQLQTAQSQQAALEAQLVALEAQIAEKQQELSAQKGQSASLSNAIAILTTQINKAKADIAAKNVVIAKLGGEIIQKATVITTLTQKIELEKESLAELLRKQREMDQISPVTVALSGNTISDIYGDVDTFSSIQVAVKNSVDQITTDRNSTETQKQMLQDQKNQVNDAKIAIQNEQNQIQQNENQQKQLLSISKSKEAAVQQVLAAQAAQRTAILNALFHLRDTAAIPFSQALAYANTASAKTGVRPAFILAIITQESNLGSNTGSCYVTDMSTGAGVNSKSGTVFQDVMNPARDTQAFIAITALVGRDPYRTLVSCPIGGFGWGGAMGPAQFEPSTWQLLASRVAAAVGKSSADPWNPGDAIMASAMYLSDRGASGGGATAEKNAACKYYSGKSCGLVTGNASYGASVMARAATIQNNINLLQN